MNYRGVDQALSVLHEIPIPASWANAPDTPPSGDAILERQKCT